MGFFDRFKKNKQEVETNKSEPLILKYSDGTIANIEFAGSCEIDNKKLHKANIMYTNPDGTFEGKKVLLEPITKEDQNGAVIDATEEYYKIMSQRDGSQEAKDRYGALKGFFKKQEITEEKIGSDYIGNIALNENGKYYRYYDKDFRAKYVEKTRRQRENEEKARVDREENFLNELKETLASDTDVHIKTSHAESLTQEKSPYECR